jgi:hypothetical protein
MSVELRSQPRRPDMTYLPPELVDYFTSLDSQIALRQRSADVLGMDYAIGWRPIAIEALPDEIAAQVRAAFEIREGHALRGDCLLAQRSLAAREDQNERTEEQRRAQLDDRGWIDSVEQGMQDLARSTGRSTGRSLLVGNVPYLRDQVVSGGSRSGLADELRSLAAESAGDLPKTRGGKPRIA